MSNYQYSHRNVNSLSGEKEVIESFVPKRTLFFMCNCAIPMKRKEVIFSSKTKGAVVLKVSNGSFHENITEGRLIVWAKGPPKKAYARIKKLLNSLPPYEKEDSVGLRMKFRNFVRFGD